MSKREVADTRVHPNRRRLTLEEAYEGLLPEPFTKEEWKLMFIKSQIIGAEIRRDQPHFDEEGFYIK